MIFVENELHHVNEADTVTKGKSANAKDNAKGKSQPKTRKRQIEDLAIDDAALVLVDEEEEGLLIQKI